MPSRGRERGLLSSPTAAAGGRWVGSEGAGVAFMLRDRGPPQKKERTIMVPKMIKIDHVQGIKTKVVCSN